uniref:Phage protein n=1 Tax=Steinernema glaseri TaxID=37863 RepID=A0A1I8A7G9_9BILA
MMNLRNGKNVKKQLERDSTPDLLLDIEQYEAALRNIPLDDVETHMKNGLITLEDVDNAEQYAHQAVSIVTLFADDLAKECDISPKRMSEIIDNLGDRLTRLYLEAIIDSRRKGEVKNEIDEEEDEEGEGEEQDA